MSEEKLYAVKNDEGEFLSFSEDGCSVWHKAVGPFQTDKQKVREWAYGYGGHVVTLVEEPEKVVVSKTNALRQGWLVARYGRYNPDAVSDILARYKDEAWDMIEAYVNGYTVAKEKKYNVKVPHTDDSYFYKIDHEICNAADSFHIDLDRPEAKFTKLEIDHYHLQDYKKEEVTDDE